MRNIIREELVMANPINGESTDTAVAAVKGENMNGGTAVLGVSKTGYGIVGESESGRGVVARSDTNYGLRAASRTSAGIRGSSEAGRGVEGWSTDSEGVVGISKKGNAVWGQAEDKGAGLLGTSKTGIGVIGQSERNEGVRGISRSDHAAVVGINDTPANPRLSAVTVQDPPSTTGPNGGWFESNHGEGVRGWSKNAINGGVVGINSAGGIGVHGTSKNGVGIYGKGGRLAGFFEGNVHVKGHIKQEGDIECTGNINLTGVESDLRLTNADCAENFDVCGSSKMEPGTVMVLSSDGALFESQRAYDKRVAGVISGAGEYKPAIVLDTRQSTRNRQPIALIGKVFCKVDAQFGAVEVGDLLTTSPTPGHAMAVSDPLRAFGTILGKALRPLSSGKGLIPILVTLQ